MTAVVAVGLVAVLLVVLPLAAGRLTRAAAEHRRAASRALTALGTVWVLCAVSGAQVGPVGRVASTSAAGLAVDQVQQVRAELRDRRTFAGEIAADRIERRPGRPAADRAARQGRAARLRRELRPGRGAGLRPSPPASTPCSTTGPDACAPPATPSRSAFLTSPTFGAASWLAHSTLQSGLWVDSEQRYDQLLGSDRLTLTSAFGRAGWRTVVRRPREHQGLAGGRGVLRLRPAVRLPQRRLRGAGVRLRVDAGPVHARRTSGAWSSRPLTGGR